MQHQTRRKEIKKKSRIENEKVMEFILNRQETSLYKLQRWEMTLTIKKLISFETPSSS